MSAATATRRAVRCVDVDCGRAMRSWGQPPDGRPLHCGRGLCASCHRRHSLAGDLADFERLTRTRGELLEEYALLAGEGYGRPQIADRLGLTEAALVKALQRARIPAQDSRRTA